MDYGRTRFFAALSLCAALLSPSAAEEPRKANFEFVDQKYGDILYALSRYRNAPIVADASVSGTASFRFAGTDFESAFRSFLEINGLYVEREDSVWTVSRVAARRNEDGSYRLDAINATPAQVIERIAKLSGASIAFSLLPTAAISLHVSSLAPKDIVALALAPFGEWEVIEDEDRLLVRKGNARVETARDAGKPATARLASATAAVSQGFTLLADPAGYSLEVLGAPASEVLECLCREERTGFASFLRADPVLSGISLTGRTLDELFAIVLAQAGSDSVKRDGVRYFMSGSVESATREIRDRDKSWRTVTLRHARCGDILPTLRSRFPGTELIALTGQDGFLACANDATAIVLGELVTLLDVPQRSELVQLKYITAQELLKSLPPGTKKEDISETVTDSSVFLSGPEDARKRFREDLAAIDQPKKRIRYDMLIVEYDESRGESWKAEIGARPMTMGDRDAISGNFGSLISLNFDAITLFGYAFSARLNAALTENRARVFADTTLHGISGETTKFQNTSTYRYRDSNVDPETGKPVYTGITREIISGIMLEIQGRASGNGMVTMSINATVSKRGADVSSSTGNPPVTSEKVINTKLSTQCGVPVILSGLSQNDSTETVGRTPFLSRLPLIGWLFRSRDASAEKSEMVIYIVPHITNGEGIDGGEDDLAGTAFDRLALPLAEKDWL